MARSKPRYQPVLDNAFYDLCLDMDTDVFAVETWCVACVSAAIYAKLGKTEEAATCSRVATKISLRWPQLPQLVVGVQLELG